MLHVNCAAGMEEANSEETDSSSCFLLHNQPTNKPLRSIKNNCVIRPPDPEGQEFVQDKAGMTWLCSTGSGVSTRKTQMSVGDLND